MRVLASCALALLAMSLASAAVAQPTAQVTVPVNRSGVFKFIAVINKVTPITGPVRAYLSISHDSSAPQGGDYFETASKAVTFNGKLGKVTIVIPYSWKGADQNGDIEYEFSLSIGDCVTDSTQACDRSLSFDAEEEIPLPMANGQVILRGQAFTE